MQSPDLPDNGSGDRRAARVRRRVFIIDDHPLVREWLANIINQQADLMVCGESEGRTGCIEVMEKKRPDVAVVDLSLKDCSGFDLIAEIKERLPGVEVVVLTMHDSPQYASRALAAGATGYVVKRETTKRVCKAIRDVLAGIAYISDEAASAGDGAFPAGEVDLTVLSEREEEIFRLLGCGNSTRQIADTLGISIKTVQVHCGRMHGKLGTQGAADLFSAAVRWNERHGTAGL
jgi:DNA-binding NarL/FixJ family response regulator